MPLKWCITNFPRLGRNGWVRERTAVGHLSALIFTAIPDSQCHLSNRFAKQEVYYCCKKKPHVAGSLIVNFSHEATVAVSHRFFLIPHAAQRSTRQKARLYLTILDNRQQKGKQQLSKELNVLVKMNRCTQQISLTLTGKFTMLSYQLHYKTYFPLAFSQEKRPSISRPTLIKTIACKFKEDVVAKALPSGKFPVLMALKLCQPFKHTAGTTLMQDWSLLISFCLVTSSSDADCHFCSLKKMG